MRGQPLKYRSQEVYNMESVSKLGIEGIFNFDREDRCTIIGVHGTASFKHKIWPGESSSLLPCTRFRIIRVGERRIYTQGSISSS